MPTGYYIRTPEYRSLMSKTLIKVHKNIRRDGVYNNHYGKHHSEETKKKIRESNKATCNTPEMKEYRRKLNLGKKHSKEARENMSIAHKGKKTGSLSLEHKIKIGLAQKGNRCRFWKGGISPANELVRKSIRYKEWRQKVFIKDNFTCQECGLIGGILNAHHIKPFNKLMNEVRQNLPLLPVYEGAMAYTPLWDINNGITFCNRCHKSKKRK